MPLIAPDLDQRKFEDLLHEARLRIPQYTPEWTDFNDSDPGMALVQLFAWFTELMLYQMNRVPELNYIKFLQMLNLELKPARPAKAHVVFAPAPTAKAVTVPERTRLEVALPDGAVPYFETTRAFELCPYPMDKAQVFDGARFAPIAVGNESPTQSFRPFGWSPQLGNALYLGFQPKDPEEFGPAFPSELLFRFFSNPGSLGRTQAVSSKVAIGSPSQQLVWEYRSRLDKGPSGAIERWRPLQTIEDRTLALTKEGDFSIQGPGVDVEATLEGQFSAPDDKRYWLRLRLAGGSYPGDKVPELALVRCNVVEVENLVTILEEVVGTSDGSSRTGQTFQLRKTPVQRDSLVLEVEVPSRPVPDVWTLKDDFLSSTNTDRHYTLNPTSGEIRFGDGRNGQIPEPGSTIVARKYRAGGGQAGNVRAETITAVPGSLPDVESVINPRPAFGGKGEESLDDLKKRAPRALRGDGRAVTEDDFRRFAEEVPGVLKAQALPGFHPEFPGYNVPGALTVIVVPEAGENESLPMPSADLLQMVSKSLDKVRLLTTEVWVAPPRYRSIEIAAEVTPEPRAGIEQVKTRLELEIRQLLHPKRWAFGKKFYPTALYELMLGAVDPRSQSRLIQAVVGLTIRVDGAEHPLKEPLNFDVDQLPQCSSVMVSSKREEGVANYGRP